MIPQSLEQWKHCIKKDCKINLTKEFAQKRLAVYQNRMHPETIKFASLYGQEHLDNTIKWFKTI